MDDLLLTVREVAAEAYEVYGELGRESAGDIWFLGRDRASARLVALHLRRLGEGPDGTPDYELDVTEQLDGSVAVGVGDCQGCGTPIRRWARFCVRCGLDVGLGVRNPSQPGEREALLEEVRAAAAEEYEVLGEMPWAGGAGIVYFAVERQSGRLVRLRLRAESDGYVLGETRALMPLGQRISASYVTDVIPERLSKTPEASSPPPRASRAGSSGVGVSDEARGERSLRLGGRPADPILLLKLVTGVAVLLLIALIVLLVRG